MCIRDSPPQVPYSAGVPLTYHWFADFHGAIAAGVAGLHVIPVFIVSSGLLAGSLALVAWELALRLMGSRRAATIATLLLFLAGGMAGSGLSRTSRRALERRGT